MWSDERREFKERGVILRYRMQYYKMDTSKEKMQERDR
jgi:hypothetical protein